MRINIIKKSEQNQYKRVKVVAKDEKTNQSVEMEFVHTTHSLERSSQRGIDQKRLEVALAYGETICKQGLIFCILGKDQIPERMTKDRDKLINTVVVLDSTSENILTCYRSKNPHRHIRKKVKKTLYSLYCRLEDINTSSHEILQSTLKIHIWQVQWMYS